jgi:ubiquinone/menaquinone biosynthesis C-methylase UbiE
LWRVNANEGAMALHHKSNDVEHFNRWAPKYDAFWGQRYVSRIHDVMLDAVGGSGSSVPAAILDVGCGTGQLLLKAATVWPNAQLVGADPAERMVEVARERLPGANILIAGAEALPIPEASVDLVLSCVSFHHWKDRPSGLAEVARVLRRDGRFCLADIVVPGWIKRLFPTTIAPTSAGLSSFVKDAGFNSRIRVSLWRT